MRVAFETKGVHDLLPPAPMGVINKRTAEEGKWRTENASLALDCKAGTDEDVRAQRGSLCSVK